MKATANAGSNIAFVKYWGVREDREGRRQALNPSVSMTLQKARTTTTVEFDASLRADECRINGRPASPEARERVVRVLDRVRELASIRAFARVASVNHLPTSAGVASSASGFCALALAAARAAGLSCEPEDLVPLAILGSGSACRSLYGGFVLWRPAGKGPGGSMVEQPPVAQGDHGLDETLVYPGPSTLEQPPVAQGDHGPHETGGDPGPSTLEQPGAAQGDHGLDETLVYPGPGVLEPRPAAPGGSKARATGDGPNQAGGVPGPPGFRRSRTACGGPNLACGVSGPPGFGAGSGESTVEQLATREDWRLVDLVAIVSREEKAVSSARGHLLAHTSPLLPGRLTSLASRIPQVVQAIRDRDLALLGEAMEADALSMHAVMMTSEPPLIYWEPATIAVIRKVMEIRAGGGPACYFTIDAGPNVHVITAPREAGAVRDRLGDVPGVREILSLETGPGAFLTDEHLF